MAGEAFSQLVASRIYLQAVLDDITSVGTLLGRVPRTMVTAYNQAAGEVEVAEQKTWSALLTAFQRNPATAPLVSLLPQQPTPVPRIVLPESAILDGASFGAAPRVRAPKALGEEAVAVEKAAIAEGRAVEFQGFIAKNGSLLIKTGAVLGGLIIVDQIAGRFTRDAEVAAQSLAMGQNTWHIVFDSCKTQVGDVNTCVKQANEAMLAQIKAAKTALEGGPGFLETLGWLAFGGIVLLVGWRGVVRYKNGMWPFEKRAFDVTPRQEYQLAPRNGRSSRRSGSRRSYQDADADY